MDGSSYYLPAVAMTIALALKTPALLRNWGDPLIRSVCALMTLAALVFCFAAPPTITELNRVTAVSNISAAVVYVLLTAFSGSCLVLITYWRGGPPETTRRLSRRWIAGYGAVCAAIVLLFLLGEAPVERVRDFDTYYANTPFLREMIVLYLIGFTVAGVAMNVMCWRWALQVRGWLRAGLLIIAFGFLVNVPFAAVKLIAVATRWQGGNVDYLSTYVAPVLSSAGAQVCALGFCLPLAGERLGDSWTTWSMYRRLGPLWRELRPVWARASHEVRISWWAPAQLQMTQRESDIHDGMLSLYPYFDAEVRAKAYDAAVAAGSEPVQARAEADAAMVTAAVRARADDPEGRVISSAGADAPAPPVNGRPRPGQRATSMSEPVSGPSDSAATTPRRAVVIGAGLAGLLAAAALRDHAEVTVVERDALPEGPESRKGVPQARHTHLLWSGGALAMEELLPGVTDAWLAAGARRIPLPTGLVSLSAQGWVRRWPEMEFMIACSRDLLESVVRAHLLAGPRVTVLDRTETLGLAGDASRITGIRVRPAGGEERVLAADLVVDAAGRGSRGTAWLDALGVAPAPMDEVDSGLVYASRIFRAPAGTEEYPVVNVQPDGAQPVPGQSATLVPIEGGRWLVTLSGTRGGQPTSLAEEFEAFAREVRHPVVGELISGAEPLTDVVVTRSTINRRRFFEKVSGWPDGFVAIGDSVATYNPIYGHGMSVAAQSALVLRERVARHGLAAPGLARRVQKAVAVPVSLAWDLATGTDIRYPEAIGKQPNAVQRLFGRYVERLMRTALGRPLVFKAYLGVVTLTGPISALVRPEVVLAVLRGPVKPPLTGPPLTERERETVLGPAQG